MRWLQVHTPPAPMLADRARCRRHARALRAALERARCGWSCTRPTTSAPGRPRTVAPSPDSRLRRGGGRRARRLPRPELRGRRRSRPPARPRARSPRGRLPPRPPPAGAHAWRDDRHREPGPGAPGTAAAVPRPAGRARPRAPAGLAGGGMLLDVGHLHITADASHGDPPSSPPRSRPTSCSSTSTTTSACAGATSTRPGSIRSSSTCTCRRGAGRPGGASPPRCATTTPPAARGRALSAPGAARAHGRAAAHAGRAGCARGGLTTAS